MITVIRRGTLAALRDEAALVPGLRRTAADAAAARQAAVAAQLEAEAARARAEAERDAALDDITAGLARLELAASAPDGGEMVRAAIALHALRAQIARVKASGDPAAIDGIRALDALISPAPAPEAGSPEPEPEEPTVREDNAVTSQAPDPISNYHHPHFISAEHGEWVTLYWFREFTGLEPEPEAPESAWDDDSLTWEDRRLLRCEYEGARCMWSKARFRRDAGPAIKSAVPVWQAYLQARSAMDAAFAAFWETGDNQWRAQILRLGDAHQQALRAAGDWDRVADGLARMRDEHLRYVGEGNELGLNDVGAAIGIDTTGWHIDYWYYGKERHGDGLVKEIREVIGEHERRLREVAELAPQLSGL